jgi:phage shock protein A
MSNENPQPTVSQMLRMTGDNTAEFMKQVAEHVEKLEDAVKQLQDRITELENANGNSNQT